MKPADHTTPLADSNEGPLAIDGLVLADRYRLESRIGTGGMGEVWRGQHLSLGVPIAVKVMHRAIAASTQNTRRFSREAHAISLLAHDHVVRVLDFGQDRGLFYIVMELLEGQTLAKLLADHTSPPPLSQVGEILSQIALALEAAHEKGIVHRDLKPDNVFLATDAGRARKVKVVDFGLAHVDDARTPETLTKADIIAGTPPYMSPEQCRSLAVGPSTDLYAIGCILTEMLQLAPPFAGTAAVDVITKQLFMPPPPLNRPPGAEPVPALLERLRLDLLAKSPDRRPSSAAQVRSRLLDALDPVKASIALPDRSASCVTGRAERVPAAWQVGNVDPLHDSPSPAREPERAVLVVRAGEGAIEAIDEAMRIGLRAHGFTCTNDASMPGVRAILVDACDRIEAAEAWLGAHVGGPPTIVCIAAAQADTIQRLIAAGASDIVTYPVAIDALLKRLRRVLQRKR